MRKPVSLLLTLCILAVSCLLFSCSGGAEDSEYKKNGAPALSVVSTIFPGYDFARKIASDCGDVSVKMLLPPGSESHDYEPTLEDMAAIADCDLFIYVGGETDRWVGGVIESIGKELNTVRLIDCVETLNEEQLEGMEHEDEDGEEADEHVWTSIRNSEVIVRKISEKMSDACPEYTEEFKSGTEGLLRQLRELDREFTSLTDEAETKVLVFADRFPFRYFAEDYGLECYAAYSGCSSAAEPTLASIDILMKKLISSGSPAVLTIEFSRGAAARLIADETGVEALTLHSCHNVSLEDFQGGVGYTDLMRRNLEVLKKVLGQG